MEPQMSLDELQSDISDKLLSSKILLEILNDLLDGKTKETELIEILKSNINSAFKKNEQCRKLVTCDL